MNAREKYKNEWWSVRLSPETYDPYGKYSDAAFKSWVMRKHFHFSGWLNPNREHEFWWKTHCCPECGGEGRVVVHTYDYTMDEVPCGRCKGRGTI